MSNAIQMNLSGKLNVDASVDFSRGTTCFDGRTGMGEAPTLVLGIARFKRQ